MPVTNAVTRTRDETDPPRAALPYDAVDNGTDIVAPAQALLQGMYLLGTEKEMHDSGGATAVFGGTPQSVAVIEASATALSKWWAAGLGAAVLAGWASVRVWWTGLGDPGTQRVVLWAAAVAAAAAILSIGYIVGSDVRGRSAASVATIYARARVVTSVGQLSKELYEPAPPSPATQIVALPSPLPARNRDACSEGAEAGWTAIAVKTNGADTTEYLLTRANAHAWVPADRTELTPPTP